MIWNNGTIRINKGRTLGLLLIYYIIVNTRLCIFCSIYCIWRIKTRSKLTPRMDCIVIQSILAKNFLELYYNIHIIICDNTIMLCQQSLSWYAWLFLCIFTIMRTFVNSPETGEFIQETGLLLWWRSSVYARCMKWISSARCSLATISVVLLL